MNGNAIKKEQTWELEPTSLCEEPEAPLSLFNIRQKHAEINLRLIDFLRW